MYIPNESLLYNTETKQLHTVVNLTYVNNNDEIITRPMEEWIPGPPLGKYTFNLVPKIYRMNFLPVQRPVAYEDVTQYATTFTAETLKVKFERAFPALLFDINGNTENPKSELGRVEFSITFKDTNTRIGYVGDFAVFETQHGTSALIQHVRAGLIEAGFSV